MPTPTEALTTENFFASCTPGIRTDLDKSGVMTLTNIEVPTPSELDGIFSGSSQLATLRILEDLFLWKLEVNAMGYKKYDLFDLFTDLAVDVSGKLGGIEKRAGVPEIAPFIYARREEPINNISWKLASGYRSNAAGAVDAAGDYWTVSVTNSEGIPLDDDGSGGSDWFHENEIVFATTLTEGGTVAHTQWKVKLFVSSGDKLVLDPAMPTAAPTTGSSAAPGGLFDWGVTNPTLTPPVTGDLVRGTNNVTPWESWCYQPPGLISNQVDPFWFQHSQESYKVSESYRKWQEMIARKNVLYDSFYNLPEAQGRRQAADDFKRRVANQLMFGYPSSREQTLYSYRNLHTATFYYPATLNPTSATDAYVGTAGATEVVTRKADAVGFYWQHKARGRVIDLQGRALNIPALIDLLYGLVRYRKQIGMPNADTVEIMCTSEYHPAFDKAMMLHYKDVYSDQLRFNADASKPLLSNLNLRYVEYPLRYPAGVTLRLVFHPFFDDLISRMKTSGNENAGRQLWMLPWKYNRMGIINTVRKTRTVGDIEELAKVNPFYQCQIYGRKTYIDLMNMCFTALSTAPMAGIIFQGVSSAVPEAISKGTEDYVQACSLIP